jgi:uncharacterized protein YwgA/uncharacterized protein YeaO (DUF488 family)
MATGKRQPTYKRQRFLLSFIQQVSGTATLTDLQKLVFLYAAAGGSEYYDFLPYKYGSYSFQLAEDIEILERDGHVVFSNSRIKSTTSPSIKNQYLIADERGDSLIRKVYREYPYYAVNSEILTRLFDEAEIEQFQQIKDRLSKDMQVLFTIGYEGKSIEAFVNALIQNGIRLLCDVRKNPISRKFGFSKNKLKHIAETAGIRYAHVPALGIESNRRGFLETEEDYKTLFRGYARELPMYHEQLESLYYLLQTDRRVALMCYEKEPEMCHRHIIRNYLVCTYGVESMDL